MSNKSTTGSVAKGSSSSQVSYYPTSERCKNAVAILINPTPFPLSRRPFPTMYLEQYAPASCSSLANPRTTTNPPNPRMSRPTPCNSPPGLLPPRSPRAPGSAPSQTFPPTWPITQSMVTTMVTSSLISLEVQSLP